MRVSRTAKDDLKAVLIFYFENKPDGFMHSENGGGEVPFRGL